MYLLYIISFLSLEEIVKKQGPGHEIYQSILSGDCFLTCNKRSFPKPKNANHISLSLYFSIYLSNVRISQNLNGMHSLLAR